MAWKFDNKKLAQDLSASAGMGFVDHIIMDNQDMIIISQVRVGMRKLRVEEFLEIVGRLSEHPAAYIVEVGRD